MTEHAVTPKPGCALVLIAPELPELLPISAVPVLREAAVVYAASGVSEATVRSLAAAPAPGPAELLARAAGEAVVLVACDPADAGAAALAGHGVDVHAAPVPALLSAVHVMDRLRSPGGCPWDAVQTHESLRQYLVEETYELLDAIETGDRAALCEELGDVLLQVLFHARVAAEHPDEPFDVDDVADELVSKLVGRHPHVFSGAEVIHTAERQQHRWEELKQQEKRRESILDGVALGQPAIALAGKLATRTGRAGLPIDLFPGSAEPAERIFLLAAKAKRGGADPEDQLRAVAKRFAGDVRDAEAAARADGRDPASLDADGWRRYWPRPK